jgi:hypothetical protein
MRRPDPTRNQLAMSASAGFLPPRPNIRRPATASFCGVARGRPAVTPTGGGDAEPVAMGVWADTPNGLGLALALDVRPGRQQAQRWTVLAALRDSNRDVTDEAHPARWHDWMQWANVLQLMRGHGRHCLITATSEADDLSFDACGWLPSTSMNRRTARPRMAPLRGPDLRMQPVAPGRQPTKCHRTPPRSPMT